MSDKVFIDSNIWLYAFMDETDPRHTIASQLIDQPEIIISTQIVNEVCTNLIRKAKYTETEVQEVIGNFSLRHAITEVSIDVILQASVLRESYSLSYWDSLVIAAAKQADCRIVYSEDMQDGLKIGNLKIQNPFA